MAMFQCAAAATCYSYLMVLQRVIAQTAQESSMPPPPVPKKKKKAMAMHMFVLMLLCFIFFKLVCLIDCL